jgi:hypothetical protein
VVVDEVYSNTVFAPPRAEEKDKTKSKGEEERGYKSVLNLYAPLPPHVHVCWGFSKIFGVAGWRVGVLVSENRRVLDAVSSLLHPHEASTDTLHGLAALLETPEFSRQFLRELHVGLLRSRWGATAGPRGGAICAGGSKGLPPAPRGPRTGDVPVEADARGDQRQSYARADDALRRSGMVPRLLCLTAARGAGRCATAPHRVPKLAKCS